jgi:hypothetical protein
MNDQSVNEVMDKLNATDTLLASVIEQLDGISKRLDAIERLKPEFMPESRIQELVNDRIQGIEDKFMSSLSLIEATTASIQSHITSEQSEKTRFEKTQAQLSTVINQFIASAETRFSTLDRSLTDASHGIASMQSSLGIMTRLIEGRDNEIKEIHADVNRVIEKELDNNQKIVRLESDNSDFQYRVGTSFVPLIGFNPWDPSSTRIMEPMTVKVNYLEVTLREIMPTLKRLLELEEKREQIRTAGLVLAKQVVTSRWFWGSLGGGLGAAIWTSATNLFGG